MRVLLVHGLGRTVLSMVPLAAYLRLHGHSPSFFSYCAAVERWEAIRLRLRRRLVGMDSAGPDYVLVGHSLGGYVASKIAAEVENRYFLDRLILVDSSGNLKKPTPLLGQYLDAAMNPSNDKVRKVFEKMVANPLFITDALVHGFIDRINKVNAKYAFEASLRNSANTQIGIKTLNKIGEKGIPTLILWGMEDKVIPMQHSQVFKKAIKDSGVTIIPATGHAPFSEKPALVCEYLHRFLVK